MTEWQAEAIPALGSRYLFGGTLIESALPLCFHEFHLWGGGPELHELSLTESVNNAILNLCERSGWRRVRRIVLKVGGMRKVNPELMSFAFSVVSKGTVTEGANLSILSMPIVFRCRACGKVADSESTAFLCPKCGSPDVELLSGLELSIDSMEVETGNGPEA